jgi:hypothetical protein
MWLQCRPSDSELTFTAGPGPILLITATGAERSRFSGALKLDGDEDVPLVFL